MASRIVRRLSIALAGTTLLTTACEDKRVAKLDTGITRDSVMSVLAKDLPKNGAADAEPNVYSRQRYLIAGKGYEVLFVSSTNAKEGKDTVPMSKLTPVVMLDNKMIGKGWAYWDSVSSANKIPLIKRD